MAQPTFNPYYASPLAPSIPAPAYTNLTFSYARSSIPLFLSAKGPVPPLPFELQGLLTEHEFQVRLFEVLGHMRSFVWATWVRVVLVLGWTFTIVVPFILEVVLSRVFLARAEQANSLASKQVLNEAREQAVYNSHLIALGVLLATVLLVWVPYLIVSTLRNRKLQALLQSYTNRDAERGPQAALVWSLSSTSTFTRRATLSVTLPPPSPPSNFHPNAYLPAYIAQTANNNSQQQTQRPKVVPYSAEVGEMDEKYHDVKV